MAAYPHFDFGPGESSGEEQEKNYDKNCDPDHLLQCPFDPNHKIRSCRFPYHLIKCRRNHPKLAKELKTCPYNARHLLRKDELGDHLKTCEDRISMEPEEAGRGDEQVGWKVPVNTWVSPEMTEDWDKEVDETQAPFVWGVNLGLKPQMEPKPNNNLGPNFRAPANLPWSNYEL